MPGTILFTGGSSGIGLCSIKEIAQSGSKPKVVVANRTPPPPPLPSNIVYEQLDLSSQASVRALAAAWSYGPISALVCNAGIVGPAALGQYTSDGVEITVAVNYLNHALLFFLLKDRNLLEPDCRIILTTTEGFAKRTDPKLSNPLIQYANTKLEMILFAYALVRRIKESGKKWTVIAFEPGFTPGQGSKLGRDSPAAARWVGDHIIPHTLWIFRMFGTVTSSPPVSGRAMAKVVLSDEYNGITGKYILLHEERPSSKDSYDVEKQEDVWNWTINTLAKDNPQVLKPF
ncbi:hypothetical protein BCR39DRAFT_589421 [Naematelia encephala]|uniref:NAD(P)-binding protein n=1 Tax=Naematelia encephala TaxID=71784 RepID=A0A1Y2AWQ8_9TREE|nr:hypothetical protein BCR39DRAFT_589421 [Naematelia encephala]